ncbi:MAG TPA: VOC family protein [Thermotogota bacterium]|nr:VOC family protein [Thermotogota bacterium]HPR96543.1 VOC family protein [Thermotogota bacterium]
MKFHSPMIIVNNIESSKRFYHDILYEEIVQDLGNYVVFAGGFSMMTREQWNAFTNDAPAGGNDGHCFELYFEEDDLDDFVKRIEENADIKQFTEFQEATWGQRTIRFLDPDEHVIEVSESMEAVVIRLLSSGMTARAASEKSMMPMAFVERCADRLDTRR